MILASLFISCQTTQAVSDSGISDSGDLSSLLRGARAEIQRWDEGNKNERDVTVYSFNPEIKLEELIQAVKDAGFYQARFGEYARDWDLTRGVLRWCVPSDTEKWDREIQFSAAGETIVHTYGFKPIPDSGVYWTAVKDSPFGSGSDDRICAIAYGGGKFVAVGVYKDESGWKGEMAYSADGVTWTKVKDSKLGYTEGIAYGGGKFVAGGEGGKMAYSTDGVTWTAAADSTFGSREYITRIFYGNGKFFAHGGGPVGNWKYKTAYSADGVTWTAVKDSALNFEIDGLIYGGGRLVAVGGIDSGRVGKIAYCTDGVTWSRADNEFSRSGSIRSIAYGGGKFVASGYDNMGAGKEKMAYSTDCITWTALEDTMGGIPVSDIAYADGKFFAATYDGKTAYSADGVTWTAEDSNIGSKIAYGGGRFVAVGEKGKMAYSNMQE
jgi:hypothetical protein